MMKKRKKRQITHLKESFREKSLVIEEEWLSDINLSGGDTFSLSLIKRKKKN